jgi:glycosyltransferase involved in cell wall biosynthesis
MDEKIHIALFAPSMRAAGMERVFLNICQGLIEKGLRVDLVLAHAAGPYLEHVPAEASIVDLGVAYDLSVGITRLSDYPRYIPKLASYLRRSRPELLLSSGVYLNMVALAANAAAGCPTTVVIRQPSHLSEIIAELREQGDGRLRYWLPKLFYRFTSGVIANSRGVARDLQENFGVPEARLRVIPNPAFVPGDSEESGEKSVHRWLDSSAPPTFLGVGRLCKQKDFHTLLRAFEIVRRRRDCRLLILGEGPERTSLQNWIDTHSLTNNIELLGHVDRPRDYMQQASVFVLSSRYEGFGNVVVEALACGCPVVSTDCQSGPAEILDDGRYGRLVPICDAAAMASAIEETLDEQPDKSTLRRRAEDFHYRDISAQYLEFMTSCRKTT